MPVVKVIQLLRICKISGGKERLILRGKGGFFEDKSMALLRPFCRLVKVYF